MQQNIVLTTALKNTRTREPAMRCDNCRYVAATGYDRLRCAYNAGGVITRADEWCCNWRVKV